MIINFLIIIQVGMIKVDFLMVMEHKIRELEPLCLLKIELDGRGYTTQIISLSDYKDVVVPKYDAQVVLINGANSLKTADFQLCKYAKYKKIINLNWEQVYSKRGEEQFCAWYDHQIKNECIQLAWGEYYKTLLQKKCAVNPNNIFVGGHMAMDLCTPSFDKFYRDKESISNQYKIPVNKQWIIFISSLSLVALSEEECLQNLGDMMSADYLVERRNIEIQTQQTLMEWLEEYLPNHDESIFLYRPHPAEAQSDLLISMNRKYNNFVVVTEESINQWIKICDKVFTWQSTSIANIYFAKKKCGILRPVEINKIDDVRFYEHANFITSKKQFINAMEEDIQFPIAGEVIRRHYACDEEIYAYQRVADICEQTLHDNIGIISQQTKDDIREYQKEVRKEQNPITCVKRLLRGNFIIRTIYFAYRWGEGKLKRNMSMYDILTREHLKKKDIEDVMNRLHKCIER